MNGTSHFVFGCGTGLLVMKVAQSLGMPASSDTQVLAGIVVAAMGAIGPDIDSHGSIINRTAPPLFVVGTVIAGVVPGIRLELMPQFLDSGWLRLLVSLFPSATVQAVAGWTLVASAFVLLISPYIVSHRGPTYSIVFTFAVTIALLVAYHCSGLPLIYGLCFGAGWASHLIADAHTDDGLPEWDWLLLISRN